MDNETVSIDCRDCDKQFTTSDPLTIYCNACVDIKCAVEARHARRETLRLDSDGNGYDYKHQAFVDGYRYIVCGHPSAINCRCYGRIHADELAR